MVSGYAASSGTVIISHEILAPAPARARSRGSRRDLDDMRAPRRLLRPRPRPPGAGRLAGERQAGPALELRPLPHAGAQSGTPWFARAFDLPTVLAHWGTGLPPDHVHVVTVPAGRRRSRPSPTCSGSASAGRSASTRRGLPRTATAPTPPSAAPRRRCCARLNQRIARSDPHATRGYDDLILGMLADETLVGRTSRPDPAAPEVPRLGHSSAARPGSSGSSRAGSR